MGADEHVYELGEGVVRVVQPKTAQRYEEVWIAEQINEPTYARLDPQHVLDELVRRNRAKEAT